MKPISSSVILVCWSLILAQHSQAELFAYDGFDYAANTAEGAMLAGKNPALDSAGSVGLNGPMAIPATILGGYSNIFQTTGLTFGLLQVTGGCGRYDEPKGQSNFLNYVYSGPSAEVGSTLYTSYLINLISPFSSTSAAGLRINTSSSLGAATAYFGSYADHQSADGPGAQYIGVGNRGSGMLSSSTTYLVIGKFSGLGMTTGARVAKTYVLNEVQLAHYAGGGVTDLDWDAAPIGEGPYEIVGKATDTYTGTNAYNLQQNGSIQWAMGAAGTNGGEGQDVKFDEMRCASTLAEVLPVNPQPPAEVPISLTSIGETATEPTMASPHGATLAINRLDATTHEVVVNLSLSGTAINGSDYVLPTTVIIPTNVNVVEIEVRPLADRFVEPDETLVASIAPARGYTFPPDMAEATITIKDGPYPTNTNFIANLSAGIPQKIVVYGTSLTADGAWSSQMSSALNTAYPGLVTVVNSGGSGMNSVWGVANLADKVINHAPNAVFIEFSVNDAVNKLDYPNITPIKARENLNSMITAIQAALPNCEIILQVMGPVIDTAANNNGASYRTSLPLCQQNYRDVGRERGLLVVDHMPAWQSLLDEGRNAYLAFVPDGLHPGASGYAQYVTPVILREIGAPNNLTSGSVMLRADNYQAAEPLTAAGASRPTKITVTRGGSTSGSLVVPIVVGGAADNGIDYGLLPDSITIPSGSDSASIIMDPASDSAAEGEESFTVGIAFGAGVELASPSKASVVINDRPIDHWRKSKFTASELLDSSVSGDGADPDNDGITNLIEFFTNHSPKTADANGAVTLSAETLGANTYLTLTFNRVSNNGLTGFIQTSPDLRNWYSGPIFVQESILSDSGLLQNIKVRSLNPMRDAGREFMRMHVSRDL